MLVERHGTDSAELRVWVERFGSGRAERALRYAEHERAPLVIEHRSRRLPRLKPLLEAKRAIEVTGLNELEPFSHRE